MFIRPPAYLFVCLCLIVCLSACLSIHPSVYLFCISVQHTSLNFVKKKKKCTLPKISPKMFGHSESQFNLPIIYR